MPLNVSKQTAQVILDALDALENKRLAYGAIYHHKNDCFCTLGAIIHHQKPLTRKSIINSVEYSRFPYNEEIIEFNDISRYESEHDRYQRVYQAAKRIVDAA